MKKGLVVFASGFICACMMIGGLGSAAAAEPITLKAVTAWPKTATEYKAFTMFTDTVDKVVYL